MPRTNSGHFFVKTLKSLSGQNIIDFCYHVCMIVFSKHAKEKFDILAEHGFLVTKEQVRRVVENPARLDHSRSPLVIAQASFDAHRVLRVVFKYEAGRRKIITFYPGRKKQYEKN